MGQSAGRVSTGPRSSFARPLLAEKLRRDKTQLREERDQYELENAELRARVSVLEKQLAGADGEKTSPLRTAPSSPRGILSPVGVGREACPNPLALAPAWRWLTPLRVCCLAPLQWVTTQRGSSSKRRRERRAGQPQGGFPCPRGEREGLCSPCLSPVRAGLVSTPLGAETTDTLAPAGLITPSGTTFGFGFDPEVHGDGLD